MSRDQSINEVSKHNRTQLPEEEKKKEEKKTYHWIPTRNTLKSRRTTPLIPTTSNIIHNPRVLIKRRINETNRTLALIQSRRIN